MKEAQIVKARKGVETPLDANIQISGFGVMTRGQLQNSIVRYLKEVSDYIRKGEFEKAHFTLYGSQVLKRFLETEMEHDGK